MCLPALAVADALVARGHDHDSIHYVGARRVASRRALLPPTGYGHTLLDVIGLQRSLSIRNLAFLPKLVGSTWRALRLIRKLSPKVVVNVGGYASFPATAAAMLRRVPFVVVSYDRRPGLVSRLIGRARAAACAVAFEGSTLPRAEITGAPVRQEVLDVDRSRDRDDAVSQLDLPHDRFVLAVVGGSLGCQRAERGRRRRWSSALRDRRDLAIYHVVGERYLRRRRARSRRQPAASCIECVDTRTGCRWSMPQPI